MEEKRRSKRIKAHLELNVSSLFKQDNYLVENIDAPITVVDVSRHGIGFTSKSLLPDGFYFNASLQLGDEDNILYCVVKIIRVIGPNEEGEYHYGCEYVGMPGILMYIFDEFEAANADQ
ncbi:MAG: PilZ domain-containing protein [Lachnospira sp.]|nr:PilZ domain-containing protein [Lachnospira sp.]